MHRSALRLHSRDHDSSIRVACRSRAPCQDGGGPLLFYAYRSAWRLRSRHYGRSVPAAHGSQPLERNARGALSFLCAARVPHESRRGHGSCCGTIPPVIPALCRGHLTRFPLCTRSPPSVMPAPVPASPYTALPAGSIPIAYTIPVVILYIPYK